ncbi:MAG: branched-chain amino acid ABC transporter permease [Candidatus Rokubacteria bacterium]|nr:branched-chain amino acid ABC transporter permease [Candidatus Rokubacteria bacterium]
MLEPLANGLAVGAAYALLGLGFTLIFGVMRRFNLAFGPTILVGVYAAGLVGVAWPGAPWLSLAAGLAATLAAGLYVERVCFAPLRSEPAYVSMISTFAVWMQFQELVSLATPSRTLPFLTAVRVPAVAWGGAELRGEVVLMAAGATALTLGLFLLLYGTAYGRAVRALTDDAEAASLMGVHAGRLGTSAFLLACLVGGAAGLMIALAHRQVSAYFGLWATVKGLTAMMLGGPASIGGAALGGLALGLTETGALWLWGGQYRDAAAYALLLLVIVWRARRASLREPAA